MSILEFLRLFMEMYTTAAAVVIIVLIGLVILKMHRVSRDLLKARLFLTDTLVQRIWMYISVAGASFALNTLIMFVIKLTAEGKIINAYYLYETTQFIFLVAFIMAVYHWYAFIEGFNGGKDTAAE